MDAAISQKDVNKTSAALDEIAKELGVEEEDVSISLDAIQDPVSLQEPVYQQQ